MYAIDDEKCLGDVYFCPIKHNEVDINFAEIAHGKVI